LSCIEGEGRISGEGKGRQICSMYFVYVYEYLTMKLVELVLRRAVKG
jgi:hypothetical protein